MTHVRPLADLKALFFDLFGTLTHFWPPREELQTTAARDLGLHITHHGIAEGYALADAFMARENAGPLPLRLRSPEARADFFARYELLILQAAGATVDLPLAARVWERVRQIPYGMVLFDDVLPHLERLRALGLTLGVITNMDRDGDELARSLGLHGRVDFTVTSREAGAEKPSPLIFRAALDRARVDAPRAAHVGDQLTSDVEGARAAGIQPVLMDRYDALDHPDGVPTVGAMADLLRLLQA